MHSNWLFGAVQNGVKIAAFGNQELDCGAGFQVGSHQERNDWKASPPSSRLAHARQYRGEVV